MLYAYYAVRDKATLLFHRFSDYVFRDMSIRTKMNLTRIKRYNASIQSTIEGTRYRTVCRKKTRSIATP